MLRKKTITEDNTIEGFNAALAKWTDAALKVEPSTPDKPLPVLAGEALDVYYSAKVRWEPEGQLPGMKSALNGEMIDEHTIFELAENALALSHSHSLYRRAGSTVAPVERGLFLHSELRQCLGFLFDDGTEDEKDAALKRLTESHNDTDSHDALALSLEGFALFAEDYREQLDKLPEFEGAMIDEALVVAQRLREQSSTKLTGVHTTDQKRYLRLRNGLITLLNERLLKVRRAARFVFRNHPSIAEEFGSRYERKQRARQRAARAAREAASAEAQSTNGATSANAATTTQEVTP